MLDGAVLSLFGLDKPVVAALNGHAIAGGCVLSCAADVRLLAAGTAAARSRQPARPSSHAASARACQPGAATT
ncbi:MAG: hypothetical protein FJ296_07630, partial [Planctomycetes bacterium]|nr:hypothetical protein [Planctomycetota bacterium]